MKTLSFIQDIWTALSRGAVLVLCLFLLSGCLDEKTEPDTFSKASEVYANGLYLQAEELFEQYLQQHPVGEHRWEAWSRMMEIVRTIRRDLPKAQMILEAMLMEFNRDTEKKAFVLMELGKLYAEQGKPYKAVEAWDDYRELALSDAEQCEVLQLIVDTWNTMARYDEALETLLQAESNQELGCRDTILYELGHVYILMQNWAQAKVVLERLVASSPNDRELYSLAVYQLSEVYLHLNYREHAAELLQEIVDMHPNPLLVRERLQSLEQ